jgi:uncharacterized protein YbaR (Trm112 family)
MNPKFLDILRCPITKEKLIVGSSDLLAQLNESIRKRELIHIDGTFVEEELKECLITIDGRMIYSIENGVPNLTPDRAIPYDQLVEE